MLLVLKSHFEKQYLDGDQCTNDNEPHDEKVPFPILSPELVITSLVLALPSF